ncbi:MAG: class I SAM-dependent methyltransferase [Acidobacteriota bacterium]
MSGYAATAPFYDPIAGHQHSAVDQEIASALRDLETNGLPVVDVGAGTGLTTLVIASALPQAEVLAVEPDPSMRAALMARLWADRDLRSRVSVLPMPVARAPLPPSVAAFVASASLVHFGPEQRTELWRLLARRLSPSGRAVLEVQCPIAEDVPETCIAKAQMGQVSYEAWASARRIDDSRQLWHVRYLSRLRDVEIDRQSTEHVCWAASADRLLAEARDFGLGGVEDGSLIVLSLE